MKFLVFTFLSLCVSCFCGNDPDDDIFCTEQYVYGLNVTCKDVSTNAIVTLGITIITVDENYQETLMNAENSDVFFGAGERAGNYIITVTSDNYQTYTSEVIVLDADECHVIPKSIEILLQPN